MGPLLFYAIGNVYMIIWVFYCLFFFDIEW